jgi:thermitase
MRYVAVAVVAFLVGGFFASTAPVRDAVDASGVGSLSLAAGGGQQGPPVKDRHGKLALPNLEGQQFAPVGVGQPDRTPGNSADAPGQTRQGPGRPEDLPRNQQAQQGGTEKKVPNQLIATFRDATAFASDQAHKQVGRVLKENRGQNSRLLEVPDVGNARQALQNNPNIAGVEDNFEAEATFTPNDSFFGYQWALPNVPWVASNRGLRVTNAWDLTRGSSANRIAILDTGMNWGHSDLSPKSPAGYNFAENNYNWGDCQGHGTATAGTAAAKGNNANGVSGVDQEALIYVGKIVTGCNRTSDYFTMGWAIDVTSQWGGTRTINMSFGGYGYSSYLCQAVSNARGRNVIFVASAGNDNTSTPAYPASCPGAVAVGATDQAGNRASFGNWGWPNVYVSAPGTNILTPTMDGWYGWWNGTSFSSPEVAGIVSLAWSRYPTISASTIISWLRYYSYNPECGWGCYTNNFGYGVPDAYYVAI